MDVPVGCEGLANGTLDRPEETMDLALGSLLPALEAGLGTPVGCEGLANGTGLGVAFACAGRPQEAIDGWF